MSLEIIGKLLEVLPEQSGEGKNGIWKRQAFIIETQDQYPKKVCINLWGDRVDMLGTVGVGETVKVGFDLESREYNGRWYTDVKAWKVEAQKGNEATRETKGMADDPFPDELMQSGGDDNDLPF